MGSTSFKK